MPDQPLRWPALLGMGAAIAAQLVAGLGLGLLIDWLANTTPIFVLVGLFLGLAAAIRYTVVEFRKYLSN